MNDRSWSLSGTGSDDARARSANDTFAFAGANQGRDRIRDFEDGDIIDLSRSSADSVNDIEISNGNRGAVIDYDGGTIVVTSVDAGNLDASDFVF